MASPWALIVCVAAYVVGVVSIEGATTPGAGVRGMGVGGVVGVGGGLARVVRNTGKYEAVRRRAAVQRKIRAGLLETSIEGMTPTVVRVYPGGNAYLLCRVENLGAHSVTWTRLKDNTVVAIDSHLIAPSRRHSSNYEEQTETWLLGISSATPRDAGQYECQVSTRPPLRKVVTLQVVSLNHSLDHHIHLGELDAEFLAQNLTALWEEVADIRREIATHLHGGHTHPNHDQVLEEVETLHHEHHVHHQQHPHSGHNAHHSNQMLRHLEEFHGHGGSHDQGHGQHHQDHDDHDHDDHDSHEHDDGSSEEQQSGSSHGHHSQQQHQGHHSQQQHQGHHSQHQHQGHDHPQDDHDQHGLHDFSGEDHVDIDSNENIVAGHGRQQLLGHRGDHHGHGQGHQRPTPPRRGLAVIPGREPAPVDPWMHATCAIEPNADMIGSEVKGHIIISQKRDARGPVHFDLDLEDFDVATTGRLYGFHIHASPVTDNRCGTAGGHFNPHSATHGGPQANVRHVGDLGNIEVEEDGDIKGHIVSDSVVSLIGQNSIVGKSIVIHAGVDDLGLGGDSGSLATGNAGGRLACCNVYITREPYYRFKG